MLELTNFKKLCNQKKMKINDEGLTELKWEKGNSQI